jgi:DNA invertase Pin-like site-specific DNA recombinase
VKSCERTPKNYNESFLPGTNYCTHKKIRRLDFKKRSRKTCDQIKHLKEIYRTCSNWSKEKISEVAKETGLSENQVYKWIWDQKKKVCN